MPRYPLEKPDHPIVAKLKKIDPKNAHIFEQFDGDDLEDSKGYRFVIVHPDSENMVGGDARLEDAVSTAIGHSDDEGYLMEDYRIYDLQTMKRYKIVQRAEEILSLQKR